MLIDQSPQVAGVGIAWAVQWQPLAAANSHDPSHPGRRWMTLPGHGRAANHGWRSGRRETENGQCS